MSMIKGGVAFFDSGIGGLNVLSACQSVLSGLPVYYYGDNVHAPYGNKSREELAPLVYQAFERFAVLQPKAAVIACNTVTALFIDDLRKRYSFPIVGCVPAVRAAAKEGGEVYVLATNATVNSTRMRALAFQTEKEFPNATLRLCGCGKLAGEIERHILERDYDFTPFLPKGKPSAVVLGCTHYSYLQKVVEEFYGCLCYDCYGEVAKKLLAITSIFEGKSPFFSARCLGRLFARKNTLKFPRFSSKFSPKKCKKIRKCKRAQPFYFLGSGRFLNAKFYKQMFAIQVNGGKVVKISQKN